MDQFIRDYQATQIKTEVLDNVFECNEVLKINSKNLNFKFLHLNIRSITKNFEHFEIFLEQFSEEFDCIVLTETWQINEEYIKLEGYNTIYSGGNLNQNDGVVMFIKKTLKFEFSIQKINECKIINAKIQFFAENITILGLYRLNPICLENFINDLDIYLRSNLLKVRNCIFAGDLNINILETSKLTNEYLNVMSEHHFKPIINDITRENEGKGTCIDHIFMKAPNKFEDYVIPIIVKTKITDHFPILSQWIFKGKAKSNNSHKYIHQINYKNLNIDLANINWDDFLASNDIEFITNNFISIIKQKIKNNTIVKKIKQKLKRRKTWISQGIINSINIRDNFYRLYKRTQNVNYLNEYKNYKKYISGILKKAKNNYYKNKIQNCESNKQMWEVINEFKNSKSNKNQIEEIYEEGSNQIVKDKIRICNIFNNYYKNMADKMARNIKKPVNYKEDKLKIFNTLYLMPTCLQEVKNTISNLKNKNSVGIDGITTKTLKNISQNIAYPLSLIMNKIFETGLCPTAFKTSIVIPIFKKGDTLAPINYRPISLITNMTKIFEALVKKRIENFVNKFSIISLNQYGFQKGKSTQQAIVSLMEDIYESVDKSRPAICIFLDLAKAFDTVCHDKLLNNLSDIGIRGTSLKLMTSYLKGRKQFVKIDNIMSTPQTTNYGVPQGTILGPLLFLLYINNLFRVKSQGKIISFADDTTIFYEGSNWGQLRHLIENDFILIKEWFDHNLLTLNIEKTFFMPFGSYKHSLPSFKTLNFKSDTQNFSIKYTKEMKFLGLTIDPHLKWNLHLEHTNKKIRSLIPYFKILKEVLNVEQLNMVYNALVDSQLRYGIVGWGGVLKEFLDNLEVTQKYILKIIYNKKRTHPSDDLFKLSKKMDCRQLYYLSLLIHTHSIKKDLINSNTRQQTHLKVPRMKKTIGQRSSKFLGPKIYNVLPENIKRAKSKNIFKKQSKSYVLNLPRITVIQQIDLKNN